MKKVSILPILFTAIFLTGCSSAKKDSSQVENDNVEVKTAASQSSALASDESSIQISAQKSAWRAEASSGRYNSTIKVSFDTFGNKTESRYFENDKRISSLMLLTKTGGEKETLIYGADGRIYKLPQNSNINVLAGSPDEIADAAGIIEQIKPVLPPTQTVTVIEPVKTNETIVTAPQSEVLPEETETVKTEKIEPVVKAQSNSVTEPNLTAGKSEDNQ